MELRHLRYFIAAAETENVSQAALKLHVSQPALSRQIRDLEAELGFALFQRSAKSVRLTEAGKAFLPEARAVLQRADEGVKRARTVATGGGELHVGYAPTPMVRLMPAALRVFQGGVPQVRVRLHDLSTEEMLRGLCQGELDLAFMVRPNRSSLRGLRFEELARDALCLAVPPGHVLGRRRAVTLEQAAEQRLVVFTRKDYPEYLEYLETVFARINARPKVAEEHDSAASLIAAVESGAGVALVPKSFSCSAGPRLTLVPVSPPPEPLIVGMAWRPDRLSPTAQRFASEAREAAAKI